MMSSHFFDLEAAVDCLILSRRSALSSSVSLLRIVAVDILILSRRSALSSSVSFSLLSRFLAEFHLCLQLLDTRERFLSGIYVTMCIMPEVFMTNV